MSVAPGSSRPYHLRSRRSAILRLVPNGTRPAPGRLGGRFCLGRTCSNECAVRSVTSTTSPHERLFALAFGVAFWAVLFHVSSAISQVR